MGNIIELCISGKELRKALADIEAAEKNGFNYCLAVFQVPSENISNDGTPYKIDSLHDKIVVTHFYPKNPLILSGLSEKEIPVLDEIFDSIGDLIRDCPVIYSDLWERGYPTDANFNWGRCQNVSKDCKFDGKKLTRIKHKNHRKIKANPRAGEIMKNAALEEIKKICKQTKP